MAWQSDIDAQKDAFALEWLHSGDPWKAAIALVGPSNAGRALQMSAEWITDARVLKTRAELRAKHGDEYFLPTKADMARKLLELLDNTQDRKTKREIIRDYNELMGHIQKPEPKGLKGNEVFQVVLSEKEAKL